MQTTLNAAVENYLRARPCPVQLTTNISRLSESGGNGEPVLANYNGCVQQVTMRVWECRVRLPVEVLRGSFRHTDERFRLFLMRLIR